VEFFESIIGGRGKPIAKQLTIIQTPLRFGSGGGDGLKVPVGGILGRFYLQNSMEFPYKNSFV
jgi:hypothetical protein